MTRFVAESVGGSEDNFNKSVVAIRITVKKTFLCLLKWRVTDEKQDFFPEDQVVENSNNTKGNCIVMNIIKQKIRILENIF